MNPLLVVLVAVRALLRNKLRSFLTTLGVIIGVGAVLAMTAIGSGARARVERMFESMGSNMLMLRSGAHRSGGVHGGAGSQPSVTWDDVEAILEQAPAVRYAAPLLGRSVQVVAEGLNVGTNVQGTTPDYFLIRSWRAVRGALFTAVDVETQAKVAVLGQTVVDELFGPYLDPIGQVLRVDNVPFEIIGVLEKKGAGGHGDMDDVVLVPVSTYRSKLQGGLQQFIQGMVFLGAVSQEATVEAEAQVEALLRARHRIRPGEQDDFEVRNFSEMASAQQEGAQTLTSLLAGIALVSLVVGGIGIMNIMLVSVTERTREIGLRMAVGAKPHHILTQFLVEALLLSVIGGVLGIASGLGAASYMVSAFGWPMLLQPEMILLAVGFSAAVGVIFGIYPAYKASRLDPIQALRYE